jgi:hypothetical protein
MTRSRSAFTALAGLTLIAAVATAGAPGRGLAIYMDGTLHSSANYDAVRRRASDYKRGTLTGWRLFGAFLPAAARADTRAIEVVGTGGQVLRMEDPAKRYPGLEPVLFLDRRNELRFMMISSAPTGTLAHGRGPGDGRGGGGQRGKEGPLAISGVTEIRVAHVQQVAKADAGPAIDLVVARKTERLTAASLSALVPVEHVPSVSGDVWPLRTLLAKKAPSTWRTVTIRGPGDARYTATRAEVEGQQRLYLRLNQRGLFKFEGVEGTRRIADVRDVKQIDVATE